LDHLFERETM